LSLAAGFAGHALYGPVASPPAARAAAEPRRDAEWEYCAVVKAQASTPRVLFSIVYIREKDKDEAVRPELVEARLGGSSQLKAIAKLADDGWEMVGQAPLDPGFDPRPGAPTPTAIFFKRRKD
ncbi:MAG TPA: hypothetical protein VF521_16130, partial [Pyrinomonadaceae bacterium]